MELMNKIFGKKETKPDKPQIKQVYLFLASTEMITEEMSEQIFPYALQQLCQTDAMFKTLYDKVKREDILVARNIGFAASIKDFVSAFIAWLKTLNVHPGDFSDLINKQIFIFSGDANDPKTGKSFQWSVFVYYHMGS